MSTPGAAHCPRCNGPTSVPDRPCTSCVRAEVEVSPAEAAEGPRLPSIRAGEVFEGKWRIEGKLGVGGMGAVFLAHDLALDRKVAIKVLARELSNDREFVARFEREARLTARLEHPNVVPVYAVGLHGVRPFMVMKKLEGMTLAQLVERRLGAGRKLDRDEVLAIFSQVCAGLAHLHSQGCVHRDLKAANIFVGPDGHATILDFGVLRDPGHSGLTRVGSVFGTPHYMSPEQARGSSQFDHRADLYALGVVLFECLTGTPPFVGETELAVVHQQAYAPPPDVSRWRPDVPLALAKHLDRALAKLPEDRFQSADEFYRALADCWPEPGAARLPQPEAPPPGPLGKRSESEPELPIVVDERAAKAIEPAREAASAGDEAPFPPPEGWVPPPPRSAPVPAGSATSPWAPDAGVERVVSAAAPPRPRRRALTVPLGMAASALVSAAVVGAFFLGREPAHRVKLTPPRPTVAASPVAAAPVARPARPALGSLRVTSVLSGRPYSASVTVDGIEQGTTPFTMMLQAGKYAVRVERQGFQPVEQTVVITPQKTAVLEADLLP